MSVDGFDSSVCYPTPQNLSEAADLLKDVKHWTITTRNRRGQRVGYECTIWADGRRVSAQRSTTPLDAVIAALKKLEPEIKLKLVGYGNRT